MELKMKKLPPAARVGFNVPSIPENIMAGAELVDAGCDLYLNRYGAEIEYEGEILYRGWRDRSNRLWRLISLLVTAID